MTGNFWPPGAATGIGSLPGTDSVEAASVVVGELPEFPHLPELPARGLGADLIGRSAAMLVDLPVEYVTTGYRVTARPGRDHRRGIDLLQWDIDAIDQAVQHAGQLPKVIKTQVAGPWTLGAGIELPRGHRVLTDGGALREFAQSLVEGVTEHAKELSARTGATVVVQLDEPTLPQVLAGSLPTASGLGTVAAVREPDAREVLASVIEPLAAATGAPVIVHCCARQPPIALLRGAGASALAVDATVLPDASGELLDEIGEAWEAGVVFLLGLVPTRQPPGPVDLRTVADPALRLVDRLGFNRSILRDQAVATPTCGLAGATAPWMRRALSLSRDLGRAFVEPPESW